MKGKRLLPILPALFGDTAPDTPASESKGTVLLIDDDSALLEMLTGQLELEHYQVFAASSAEKALALLARATPDAIILDIGMPGLGGLGFLKRFGKDFAHLQCPIVVFTGRHHMESFFNDASVFAFMAKPGNPELFMKTVRAAVGHHQAKGRGTSGSAARRRLLLVEDDELRRYSLSNRFSRHGYDVHSHDGGHTLLEAAANHQPVVILMKYILPGRNGPALAEQLGNHPSTRHIPVILYDDTATYVNVPDLPNVRQLVPSGKDDHLLKAIHQCAGSG